MNKDIVNYLNDRGIPFSTKGFNYLHDAIKCVMSIPKEPQAMEIYRTVGMLYGATAEQVERAMRYSIRRSGCSDYVKEFIVKAAVMLKAVG